MNEKNIFDLDPETLNQAERDSLNSLLAQMSKVQLTLSDFKVYLNKMKDAVCLELADTPGTEVEKNINLKARIRVYVTLLAFLDTPDKARAAVEKAIANVKIADKPTI